MGVLQVSGGKEGRMAPAMMGPIQVTALDQVCMDVAPVVL